MLWQFIITVHRKTTCRLSVNRSRTTSMWNVVRRFVTRKWPVLDTQSWRDTMSRCHVAPHVIETEIELFLDNFKYVTSLLQNEFSVLDCRSSLQSSYHPVLLSPNDNNRLSWPDDTESSVSHTQGHTEGTFTLTLFSRSRFRTDHHSHQSLLVTPHSWPHLSQGHSQGHAVTFVDQRSRSYWRNFDLDVNLKVTLWPWRVVAGWHGVCEWSSSQRHDGEWR